MARRRAETDDRRLRYNPAVGELPIQPDEATLEELLELARRLMEHPENRPGADKTWVLNGLRSFQSFLREVRKSGRFSDDEPAPLSGAPSGPAPPHST